MVVSDDAGYDVTWAADQDHNSAVTTLQEQWSMSRSVIIRNIIRSELLVAGVMVLMQGFYWRIKNVKCNDHI